MTKPEMYDRERYFTVAGHPMRIRGGPSEAQIVGPHAPASRTSAGPPIADRHMDPAELYEAADQVVLSPSRDEVDRSLGLVAVGDEVALVWTWDNHLRGI
jgi:hypothetical protein